MLHVIQISAFPAQIEKVKALQIHSDIGNFPEINSLLIGRYPRQNHITSLPAESTQSRAFEQNSQSPEQEENRFNKQIQCYL